MFNDIGALELLTLVVIAVIVFGPEKLPKVIQDITRTIRKIREFSDSAKEDIRTELGPQFKDFEFEDLNPKTFLRKQLSEGGDDLGLKEIRESFDLRKEMAEITDAVNGRESASSTAPAAGTPDLLKKEPGSDLLRKEPAPDLLKKESAPDLLKKETAPGRPEKPALDERPPFDADAT
ncbi:MULTISPECIES: sec-independent translocase [Streptomyces]|uniref:Sec-independent protein translocase protein TatB n=1 Tax=Streptomyces halstedii TaxID=1944 RepID=A0A6N9U8T7_STRHA|nr:MULTISPECIES: sec-independent translocase [Streptomyces]AWL40435.1 Sec-independent protein translocase TatB [Streptomyces sp. SM18]MBV7670805.1 Sec-independent protein translocase subunit TatB [Streptomyces halstedii]NEA18366.1 Sec-independent protein translocase subunit TatB [Streptomyces halstedii]